MPSRLTQLSYRLEMGAGVGVGQRNGGSSSYHMPVHRRVADCRAVSAKASLTVDLYSAALFVILLDY